MHNNKRFVDREAELSWLNEAWRSKRSQLLVIYGRRRVGKTSLIEHFAKGNPHIYYLCSKGVEVEQLGLLSGRIAAFFGDSALGANPFRNWDGLFNYLAEKAAKQRFMLVIDEFPFLVRANPAVVSIFQKYWDELLSKTQLMLVLCGSSIAMMESKLLAYKSPLYGRRTGQWKVMPLAFRQVIRFFPKPNLEMIVPFYSVTGGIPFYLNELDMDRSIMDNLLLYIARKGKILYEEGEFLLKEELAEPETYFSILKAVAESRNKQAEIANAVGMPATAITRYLTTLIRLGFLERKVPVTEKPRTKKASYAIADPFLQFWFRFIYPNKPAIEEGEPKAILSALGDFGRHTASIFERVCAEALRILKPFEMQKIGVWWGAYRERGERKIAEIDIVALNESSKEILFAECKWQHKVNADSMIKDLKDKARYVNWSNKARKEYFAVFAKSFSKKCEDKNTFCFDLKDLEKLLRRR